MERIRSKSKNKNNMKEHGGIGTKIRGNAPNPDQVRPRVIIAVMNLMRIMASTPFAEMKGVLQWFVLFLKRPWDCAHKSLEKDKSSDL